MASCAVAGPVTRPAAATAAAPAPAAIVVALVVSMMLTLFARLYYVQLLDPHKPTQTARATHDGAIVLPAPRGLIVDAQGHVLVGNTTVAADHRQPRHAAAPAGQGQARC